MSTSSTVFTTTPTTRRSGTFGALLVAAASILGGAAVLGAQHPPQQAIAEGWYAAGSTVPGEYRIGLEPLRRPGGTGFVSATITGSVAAPYASGILLQSIRADEYRGRRVRLTGWLRTAGDSTAEARLWVRVDGPTGPQVSDYMLDRPITGTRDWAQYSVVLDVPGNAVGISFGGALTGRGQMWLDDLAFERVDGEVVTTETQGTIELAGHVGNGAPTHARRVEVRELRRIDVQAYRFAPLRPVNLGFEQATVIASR